MQPEPIFDLAHLGHMELLTPKPDESLKFFVDVMGMTISGRKGESVDLRGWDDYERYSLKLTASKTSGMEHMALRARSPQALERRVAALKGSGFDTGWTSGGLGPSAALSGAGPQRPPPRSSQLSCGRHQGQPDLLRAISGLPADRADRAQRRHG